MLTPQQTSSSPVDVLAQTESFRTLDRLTLEILVDAADIDQVGRGQTLFQIGEPFGQVVYILYAGRMRKRRRSGGEADAHLGEWLGLTHYVDRTPFGFTAEAVTDCAVLGLDVDTLDQLEQDRPSLGFFHQLVVTSRNATGAYIDLKRNGLRLAEFCQVELWKRHTAYGDAVMTALMFKCLAERLTNGRHPVSKLIKWQTQVGFF
jgi:signal-transduction protein with cAMP-binding, CBS, and nucleotidyltransferase domain